MKFGLTGDGPKKLKNIPEETLERITDAFVGLDENWCYTYMNRKAGEIFGRNPVDIIGKHIWTEFPEGIDQPFYKAYYKAMAEQQYIYVEENYAPYDLWFENHIYPSPDGLSIFFRDITEKKKAAERLKEKNNFIESIINASPDIIYIYDIEERKNIYVNEGIQINLGYTDDDIKQMGDKVITMLMHPEDFDYYLANTYPKYATAIDKESIIHEYRMRDKKGDWHWLNCKESIFLRKPDGTPKQIFGITNDITERKKAEEEIKKEKELSDKIINSLPGIFYLSDQTPRLLRWNKALEKISGYTSEELEKILPGNLFDQEDHSAFRQALKKTYSDGLADLEVQLLTKSGQKIPFYFTGVGIEYQGKPAILGTGIDISERKKAEEGIKEKSTQLQTLSNNLPDTMMYQVLREADGTMNFTYLSKTVEFFACKTPEEVIQNHALLYHIIWEDDRRVIAAAEEVSFRNMSVFNVEVRYNNLLGEQGWLHIRSIPRKQDDGRVIWDGIMTDITERKKAVEEITKIYKEMDTALNRITDSVISVDSEWQYTFLNDAALTTHPMSKDETMGKLIWDVHPGLSESLFGEKFKEAMQTQVAVEFESYYAPYNIWVNMKVYPSKDGLTLYYEDISERKKAEQSVKDSEEKYRTLVEQASDAIFIANAAGRFITVNTSACKLSQCSAEELLQMSIYDFAIIEDIQREPFHFDELKQGKTVITERVMKRKDGLVLNVEITAKLLSDGRLLTFLRDISERIKTQNEVIKEKNLSDSIINSLPGIFYLYNEEGKFLRWNKNFETVSGYTNEEISKMHPLDFFYGSEKELVSQKITNVFISGADNVLADFLLKTKQKIPYYFTGIAIAYEDKPCLIGVGIDFSERVKAQEEIKQTSEKLRQLTTHLQKIREEERKRIGREIHDELGQQLTAIKMDVAWVNKKMPHGNADIKIKLKNVITLLDGSNQSIRRILSELRPGILDNNGLLEALEWLNRQFTLSTGIPVEFTANETAIKITEEITTCIFRVYQEAFTNITRYANAKKVVTSLSIADNTITVDIEDDGKSFDAEAVKTKKSFGILGMRERVLSLNGKFNLVAVPGKGTKIIIHIPF